MKHTLFSLGQIALNKPQTIAISAIIAGILDIYVLYMGILLFLVFLDSILGGLLAYKNEKFSWQVFFKKTGIKSITYACGIAAFLVISYFPFDGSSSELMKWGHRSLVLWLCINEYLSIALKGTDLGIKLAPTALLKQLKAAQKAIGEPTKS